MKIIYTKHAEEKLTSRNIRKNQVKETLNKPDKVFVAKEGKRAYLKEFGRNFLKVIVLEEGDYKVVITSYWIEKKRVIN